MTNSAVDAVTRIAASRLIIVGGTAVVSDVQDSWRRACAAALILSLPVAVVLALLLAFGQLQPIALPLGWAGAFLGAALLLRRQLAAVERLAQGLRRRLPEALKPAGDGPLAELARAAAGLLEEEQQRRRVVERMADSRDLIVDSLPEPLLLLDGQMQVRRANLAARRLLGQDAAGRDLAQVLRHPRLLEAARRVLAGSPGEVLETALPDGRSFTVRVEPLPVPGPDGTTAMVLLHDVTAARRSEQMRANFVANVSHELRTPLSTLTGFIETLQGPARDDEEARERFLEIMASQAQRMGRLVNDLLSLSAIELNEHTPPRAQVDLAGVLRRVTATLEMKAEARGMSIALDIAEGLPPVLGDADELAQVAQNLIDNALKYGRVGTPVTVTASAASRLPAAYARPEHGAVMLAVADQGEGIPREHIPRLTERFYRVDAARSRELGGTGLGLAIVKHIVSHHRGHLAIESRVGKGSRFVIHLPAAPSAAPAAAAGDGAMPPRPAAGPPGPA
ncbi:MAG: ATP-binding protein [Thalassobaculales bacterium]